MSSLNELFIHAAILSIRSHNFYSIIILFPKSYKKILCNKVDIIS